MGLIRGSLVVLVSVCLFSVLILNNTFLTMGKSLEYENVASELSGIFSEVIEENMNIDYIYPSMRTYCMNNSEYVFFDGSSETTFVIPCETVFLGQESVLNYSGQYMVNSIYYNNPSCELLDCIKESKNPTILISQKSSDYWYSKFYYFLFVSLILFGLLFFFVETKSNALILTGVLGGIAAVAFSKIDFFLKFILEQIFSGINNSGLVDGDLLLKTFSIFFTQSSNVFVLMFTISVLIFVAGILWKLFEVGFSIKKFFDNFGANRKVSKKEVEKIFEKKISKGKK